MTSETAESGPQPRSTRDDSSPDRHAVEAQEIARIFRAEYGQVVATLVRVFGDIDIAEDAVQDAFVTASDRWHRDGLPPNPGGWITTAARNKAIDRLRRETRGRALLDQVGQAEAGQPDGAVMAADVKLDEAVGDDRLRLMFTCCHPALRTEHQVALTLRLLGGLGVDEVARSFLVTEAAMAKRLVRAKHKIKVAKIPYRVPDATELPNRVRSVLAVVYLIYNTGADSPDRDMLRTEALRLARSLVELMPDEAEATGLLALLLLTESRHRARTAGDSVVLLRDQDRGLWDRGLIGEGQGLVRACIRRDRPGPYQLQAAINAVHCDAAAFADTDWAQIVTLYDALFAMLPTPVVALNRAIAIGEVDGAHAALDVLAGLDAALADYYLFHATHADLLVRVGSNEDAAAAYTRAIALAPTGRESEYLSSQLDALTR